MERIRISKIEIEAAFFLPKIKLNKCNENDGGYFEHL